MKSRFRVSRGPLRWWLLVCGLLLTAYDPVRMSIGLALVAAGAALHLVAKACLWQNRFLSTAGPYRFTRNPFYLANLAIDAGLLVVIGNAWLAGVFALLWILVYRRTIAAEERMLRDLFEAEFEAYCGRVPRLFPSPWRYLKPHESTGPALTWDNPNLSTGTEWRRVFRILSCPWILALSGALRPAWYEAHGPAMAIAAVLCALSLWVVSEAMAIRSGRRRRRETATAG